MTYRIVSDSSCDVHSLAGIAFSSVPLRIVTEQKSYVDDEAMDAEAMVEELLRYKGKSSTACPNVTDWMDAFGEADAVFALTITSALSGSHNAAMCAKADYEAAHPDRRVHVIDTLSTGPEIVLLMEKLRELVNVGLGFEEIISAITDYQKKTKLLFLLSSIRNLARNGRVSRIGAEAVGLLGIRIYGQASSEGKLDILGKCRGEQTALARLASQMERLGWRGGPVRIAHCLSAAGAQALKMLLLERQPGTEVQVYPTGGLCSFYAEKGGIMVGFETA